MSYGTNLLTTSYPSTLLSDGYVQRSEYETMYPTSMSYLNNPNTNRLFNDDTSYNPSWAVSYRAGQTNGFHGKPPPRPSPGNNWSRGNDAPDPLTSMIDITEYSESMGTASNTNTASSVARTIEDPSLYGPTKQLSKYPPNPMWNQKPAPTTNMKKTTYDESKRGPPNNAPVKMTKRPVIDESKQDLTPVPSPRTRLGAMPDGEQPLRSMNIEAWLNESRNNAPLDDQAAEQAWLEKINQLQMAKAQKEKDKIKSSRALPMGTKKPEMKSNVNVSRPGLGNKSQEKPPGAYSHFDSLFEGDFYRPTNYSSYPSPPKPKAKRPKPPKQPTNYPLDDYDTKSFKYIPPSRTSRYEPPFSKRPPHAITTSSWRSHWPRHHLYDSHYPYYLHPDFYHHEYIHKDEEERYREALQILRAERAEQQQRQINETTAKRLNYGDYVRNSTKDGSLPNAVKPSPWSDFMDMKKGNVYTIAREEKKKLYRESKSYGERVRHRNVGFSDTDLSLSYRASMPFLDDTQELPSSNLTPRQTKADGPSKSISRTSKHRPDSASTKQTNHHRNASNPNSRNNLYRRVDDDQGAQSDTGLSQKSKRSTKKKNVHYGKYDSSGRTTSATEDSDTEVDDRTVRSKATRLKNDNLFTVREERTLESMEAARQRKTIPKQKK